MTTPAQIVLTELSADPTAFPPSGSLGVYAKTDDSLWVINSSGTPTQVGGGTPGGSNQYVQYNNSGAFGGDIGMQYNPTGGGLGPGIGSGPELTVGDYSTSTYAGIVVNGNSGGNGSSQINLVSAGTGISQLTLGQYGFGPGGVAIVYTQNNNRVQFAESGDYQADWTFGYSQGDSRYYVAISGETGTYGPPGQLSIGQIGAGFSISEGSNAKSGLVTLVGGTIAVSNTSVTANSRFILTVQSLGTVILPTMVAVTSQTPGTGFTITSADPTDTSVIYYQIVEAI